MKQKKILLFLLLLSMSFSLSHAFVIDILETHQCQVNEYVKEFSQPIDTSHSGDICNIHHSFHTLFIIPVHLLIPTLSLRDTHPQSLEKSYKYVAYETEIKPPINL